MAPRLGGRRDVARIINVVSCVTCVRCHIGLHLKVLQEKCPGCCPGGIAAGVPHEHSAEQAVSIVSEHQAPLALVPHNAIRSEVSTLMEQDDKAFGLN